MKYANRRQLMALSTAFLTLVGPVKADVWSDWLDSKVKTALPSSTPQGASTAAQVQSTATKSTPKQSQSIAIDQGSTSLVDQSSGSDLVSSALNLLPVASNTATGQSGSGTVSASAYAIYALASQQDALAPSVYNKGASEFLRSMTITLGREQQNTTSSSSTSSTGASASTSASSPNAVASASTSTPAASAATASTPAGTIYGFQWTLPVSRRDATRIATEDDIMADIATIATKQATLKNGSESKLKQAVCAGQPDLTACENEVNAAADLDKKIAALSKTQQALVNKIVIDYQAGVKEAAVDQEITDLVTKLKRRPQFAVNFQSTQRSGTAANDYRGELIYDQGLKWWDLMLTLNGSFDYSDSPKVGADLRTGRGAFQLSRNITQAAGAHLRSPLQVNLSGEGSRVQSTWHYAAQVQLVVPISTGVDLPLSFGYANELDVLRQLEKGVYGKFGLAFDFSKIADALKGTK